MNPRMLRHYMHCIVVVMLLLLSRPAYAQFELDPIVRDRNPLAGEWTDEIELGCVMGEPPQNVRTLDCPISGSIPGTWWSLREQVPTGWQMRLANKSTRAIQLTLRVWDLYDEKFSSWMKHPPEIAKLPAQGTRILNYPNRLSDDSLVSAAVLEWHYVDADGKSAWQSVREDNGIQYRWSSPGLGGNCTLEFRDTLLERATSVSVTTTFAVDPGRPDSTSTRSVNITPTQNGVEFINGICLYVRQVSAPNPARSFSPGPAKIQR